MYLKIIGKLAFLFPIGIGMCYALLKLMEAIVL